MSDKYTDDRDIDEILASIDEMLSQKDTFSYKPDNRKDFLQQVARESEEKLGLSSSITVTDETYETDLLLEIQPTATEIADLLNDNLNHTAAQADIVPPAEDDIAVDNASEDNHAFDEDYFDEDFDDEEEIDDTFDEKHSVVTPRHRIILTEALLEPSVQEALPLWLEQDEAEQNFPETSAKTSTENFTPLNDEEIDSEYQAEAQEPEDIAEEWNELEDTTEILEDVSEAFNELDDLAKGLNELDDTDDALEDTSEDLNESEGFSEELDELNSIVEHVQAFNADSLENKLNSNSDDTNANNNSEDDAFDISEALGVNTVYKLEPIPEMEEVENTELVEAMMEDILGSDTERENASIDETSSEKKADSTPVAENNTPAFSLDEEHIEALIDSVSNDIASQLQQQFQMALRNLVRESIQKHLDESGFTSNNSSNNTDTE